MKKALAPFAMIARHSLWKVLAVLTLLTAGNAAVFFLELDQRARLLSVVLDSFGLTVVFLVLFIVLSDILCRQLIDRGGHQNYFLHRLRLCKGTLYWNHVLYNSLCYFLLFAVEALSLLALCMVTVSRFPENYNHQSIVVACYQSDLLHTFFPLSDWLGWLTNAVLILGLGICTAAAPARNRSGRVSVMTIFMMGLIFAYLILQREAGAVYMDVKIIALVAALPLGAISYVGVRNVEVKVDDQT